MLSPEEVELVATLRENAAFKLLLEAVEAEIDTLATKLQFASSKFEQKSTLAMWKALRLLHTILKTTPEQCVEMVNEGVKGEDDVLRAMDVDRLMQARAWAEKAEAAHKALLNFEETEREN